MIILLFALQLCAANTPEEPDPTLFEQMEAALQARNGDAYFSLLGSDPELQAREQDFLKDFFAFPFNRAVLRLMEEKDGRLLVHVFLESPVEARFESWSVRTAMHGDEIKIEDRDVISEIKGLYRLRLNEKSMAIRDFEFKHLHTKFHLKAGRVFPVLAGPNLAGIFFIGKGDFEFSPEDEIERHQVKLFNKRENLKTSINHFYLRTSAQHMLDLFGPLLKQEATASPDEYQRATNLLKEYDQTPYSVKIPFTEELWFPLLKDRDLYSEIHTPSGTFIYQHAPGESDDVLLAQRDSRRVISLYNSSGIRIATDEQEDCSFENYNVQGNFDPHNTYLSAVTSMRVKCNKETALLVFKLSSNLRVSSIRGSQSSLIYFQEEKTANLNVVLNEHLPAGKELPLEIAYSGTIPPEVSRLEASPPPQANESDFYLPPSYLYSNRSMWYPQFAGNPYLKADVSITVPQDYVAVANGKLLQTENDAKRKTFHYSCRQPAKYLSLFVGQVDNTFTLDSVVPIRVYHTSYDKSEARAMAEATDRMLRFYSNYFGSYPYDNLTLILRPLQVPGGHSPATIVIVNRVYSFLGARFKKDPLNHPDYPHLLLAHEVAHQWWGQAVGWRSYRDQWISEGFAQFAAWEFIRQEQGEKAWAKLGRVFFGWIKDKSYAGPIVLGARLGHLTNDPQAFTALLYNKSAYVLAMLKNWMGVKNFGACLKEFYARNQFRLAGFIEFSIAAENHSRQEVHAFLRPWLYGWDIPTVRWSQLDTIKSGDNNNVLRIQFTQQEDSFYRMSIPVEATGPGGKVYRTFALLDEPETDVEIALPFPAGRFEIDPYGETLMKAVPR